MNFQSNLSSHPDKELQPRRLVWKHETDKTVWPHPRARRVWTLRCQ